jgi:hypothetical protein
VFAQTLGGRHALTEGPFYDLWLVSTYMSHVSRAECLSVRIRSWLLAVLLNGNRLVCASRW